MFTAALLLPRIQILPYWIGEGGRRIDYAPVAALMENAEKHWEITARGENMLLGLAAPVLILILFEWMIAALAKKKKPK